MKILLTCSVLPLLVSALSTAVVGQTTLHVDWTAAPGGNGTAALPFQTIQAGITAATKGDTVVVEAGVYFELVNFVGKDILLTSFDVENPQLTVIDGGGSGPVVTLFNQETEAAILRGFTIRNGNDAQAGGILIGSGSPTVERNVLRDNFGPTGTAIRCLGGSPMIRQNTIRDNGVSTLVTRGGSAIRIEGFLAYPAARILDNIFINNRTLSNGGAIRMTDPGVAIIEGNYFEANTAARGGAIDIDGLAPVQIANNLFVGNVATIEGGAMKCAPSGATTSIVTHNTFVENSAGIGSALWVFDSIGFANNLVVGGIGNNAVYFLNPGVAQSLLGNNVFVAGIPFASAFGGSANVVGTNGNIAVDPQFVDAAGGDFRLSHGSPCIDTGASTGGAAPDADIEGNPRLLDGNLDGVAAADIGAFEFNAIHLSAPIPPVSGQPFVLELSGSLLGATTLVAIGTQRASISAPPFGTGFVSLDGPHLILPGPGLPAQWFLNLPPAISGYPLLAQAIAVQVGNGVGSISNVLEFEVR